MALVYCAQRGWTMGVLLVCGVVLPPEQQIKIVKEWIEQHPRKTRQSVFLEQYPNAKVEGDGVPCVYPCQIEHDMDNVMYCNTQSCVDCRRKFWMQEVE